jgi:phosphomannomutase
MDATSLLDAARAWIAVDPDPETRAAAEALLRDGDERALREHFGATLDFGTGGMRGAMGPGTNRMNRLMIRRVTAALAAWLEAHVDDAKAKGVALAWDARRGSAIFAEDAARVLAARGFTVHLAPTPVPTPVLSFATPLLGAAAGVIVTASHNPADDNGYKVFGARGNQILAPVDTEVQAELAKLAGRAVPVDEATPLDSLVRPWPASVVDTYFARIGAQRVHPEAGGGARIVTTPLHGVGGPFLARALAEAGYRDVHVVPSQAEPDGAFPTVPFPNPEEHGVLDRAIALAEQVGADVVLANDPDADRVAVAVPTPDGWRQLTGNEVGVLLGEDLLAHRDTRPTDLVVTTIVSTSMLRRIADAHEVQSDETLTGFKWIADRALRHEATGGRFLFGFEESIGYSVGDVVRDKDGVSAGLLVADLVAMLKAQGATLLDALEGLHRRHGLHVGRQRSLRMPGLDGLARIRDAMASLRAEPPRELAGRAVAAVVDVKAGVRRTADGETSLSLPRSDVLAFELEDGGRVLARPSGTEPKLKLYFEVVQPLGPQDALVAAEAKARGVLDRLEAAVLTRLGLS